jgi:anti-anti-sigma regulatory factor
MTATIPPRHLVPDVSVGVDRTDGVVTARVRGRVGYMTVGCMRDRLLEVAHSDARVLVVDLSDTELLDPTGPAAILHVHDVCRTRGMPFSVVFRPGSAVEGVLRDCGLLSLFKARRTAGPSSTAVVPG